MPSRRDIVLGAAVRVLGRDGPRGLTHRAIDAEASLPEGSTSNLYRRRSDLIQAVTGHMIELVWPLWGQTLRVQTLRAESERDAEALADTLAVFVRRAAEPEIAEVLRARYYLQLSDSTEVLASHHRFVGEAEGALESAGVPAEATRPLLACVDGFLLQAVTFGVEALPSQGELRNAFHRLMRP